MIPKHFLNWAGTREDFSMFTIHPSLFRMPSVLEAGLGLTGVNPY